MSVDVFARFPVCVPVVVPLPWGAVSTAWPEDTHRVGVAEEFCEAGRADLRERAVPAPEKVGGAAGPPRAAVLAPAFTAAPRVDVDARRPGREFDGGRPAGAVMQRGDQRPLDRRPRIIGGRHRVLPRLSNLFNRNPKMGRKRLIGVSRTDAELLVVDQRITREQLGLSVAVVPHIAGKHELRVVGHVGDDADEWISGRQRAHVTEEGRSAGCRLTLPGFLRRSPGLSSSLQSPPLWEPRPCGPSFEPCQSRQRERPVLPIEQRVSEVITIVASRIEVEQFDVTGLSEIGRDAVGGLSSWAVAVHDHGDAPPREGRGPFGAPCVSAGHSDGGQSVRSCRDHVGRSFD